MIFRKPSKDIRGSCVLNGKIQVTRMEICASNRFTYLIHLCFIREIVNKNLNNSGHKGHCLQNTIFSLNYELLSCFPVSPLKPRAYDLQETFRGLSWNLVCQLGRSKPRWWKSVSPSELYTSFICYIKEIVNINIINSGSSSHSSLRYPQK